MNPLTYWQWVLDGMGGVVGMAQRLAESDAKPSKAQVELLDKHIKALKKAYDGCKDKASDK